MTDADIVGRVLAGDVDAFALIVARYYGRCLRYASRVLANEADADDVVQDTFVRAYDALGRYEERNRFPAWLFQILVTECRGALSRRSRRERIFVADPELLAAAESPPESSPELRDAVTRALGRLEPILREAFLLRHVEELSYEEMQMITGAKLSALKMRVKRACEALRAHIGEPA